MTITYDINFRGEPEAGLRSYTDTVSIDIESGFPGGKSGEFEEFIRQSLSDWYDGADVSYRRD